MSLPLDGSDRDLTMNGAGPSGEGLKSGRVIIIEDNKRDKQVCVPALAMDEFCRKYGLSDTIQQTLAKEGFQTAGALLETSEASLKDAGLRIGEIGELRTAFRVFLSIGDAVCSRR
ncbi:hypothetical protein DFH07DRAFT_963774 [Mycena maculata]|uniref:SAM domain-containing protein n=1 Tax=Mycena maculata TaxID=230809 RepID=A0AAD7IL26_9AGAR|nr:hypothetical protein DFH07DRAFT_963774 [Mycena maculata]